MSRSRSWLPSATFLLIVPALLLMLPVYAYPTLQLVAASLDAPTWSTIHYEDLLEEPAFWPILTRTFVVALQVTVCCALLGYPIAYAMLLAPPKWRQAITVLIVLPMWISLLVRSYAWIVILGRDGLVNKTLLGLGVIDQPMALLYTRLAVLLGLVQVMLPYFVLPVFGAMSRVDLRLVSAARALGASRRRAFFSVFFPLTLSGVASGALIIFILTIGFYVTPTLLGGLREITYVMLIERQVNNLGNWNLAAAMSVVLLAATLVLVMLFGRSMGFRSGGRPDAGRVGLLGRMIVLAATRGVRPPRRVGGSIRPRRPGLVLAVFLILCFVVLPTAVVIPLSFSDARFLTFPPPAYSLRWYETYFSRSDWLQPTWTSLKVAFLSMAIATTVGTLASIGLARARFRASSLYLAFLLSPTVLPHLVIAIGLYFQLAKVGLVGTVTGIVLGHVIFGIPLVIVVVLNALRTVDTAPERAARSLGAGPARAFLDTTFVLIRPSLIAAAFFAFLTSFDDLIVALFISGTTAATLPKRMWEGIVIEIDPTVAAVSILLVILSLVLFVLAQVATARLSKGRGIATPAAHG